MDSFEYFSLYIFPLIILIIGLVGNYLGFKTMERPKMLEIGPRNTYKYLFISDTIYLTFIIGTYLQYSFNIDPTILSNVMCKLWWYIIYSFDSQSSMLLVYISIDRYVSIKIPSFRFFMRKRNNQLIFFIFKFMFNLIYYLPVVYNSTLVKITNETLACSFKDQYAQDLISYMDLANLIIFPSTLIFIFSILLGIEVIKSRSRILDNFLKEENEFFFKNISLTISLIVINIVYLLLVTPNAINSFVTNYTGIYEFLFMYYLFYLSYSIKFYVLFITNSLFRKEFILFLKGSIKHLFN
jgi:hypothetical protein